MNLINIYFLHISSIVYIYNIYLRAHPFSNCKYRVYWATFNHFHALFHYLKRFPPQPVLGINRTHCCRGGEGAGGKLSNGVTCLGMSWSCRVVSFGTLIASKITLNFIKKQLNQLESKFDALSLTSHSPLPLPSLPSLLYIISLNGLKIIN